MIEGVERRRAYDREWKRADRAAHPDKYRVIDKEKLRRRRLTHPGAEQARGRRWYLRNLWITPWLIWRNNRVRARRYGIDPGRTTKEDLARLRLLPCVYCGQHPANGVDHVEPFARGGSNEVANLTPACLHCNKRKFVNAAPA